MDSEHAEGVVGCGSVGVDYFGAGPVEGAVVGVESACEVDVFGVHEESFVEEPYATECVGAQEHEASLVVGDVVFLVGV